MNFFQFFSFGIFIIVFQLQLITIIITAATTNPTNYTPVVMYHGIGDTADGSLVEVKNYIQKQLPGIYVTALQMGSSSMEDKWNSYFMNLNKQVATACRKISQDPRLANGYNIIGYSQGGQVARAIAQRCPTPPVRNLISLGGQHQGVYGLPNCPGVNATMCDLIRKLINFGVYLRVVQDFLVPAEYWHDSSQEDLYRKNSIFLADINNERKPRNTTYKENLLKLRNLILVKFNNDTTVQPKDSEWFEFYTPGQSTTITRLRNSSIYTEDWIGLRQLNEDGRLKFLSVNGDHLKFTLDWFDENILQPYLK